MSLDEIYKEIILDHYRNPRNRGELPVPPAIRVEGFNPLCGDEVNLYLEIDGGKIADIKLEGQGCSISQSAASMMTEAVKGIETGEARKKIAAFKEMMSVKKRELAEGGNETRTGEDSELGSSGLGELESLKGVVKFPVRIKCATLAWNTLDQGLREAEGGTEGEVGRFVETADEDDEINPAHFRD